MYLCAQVFNPDSNEASMKINLQWPGDVFDLQLPASTFYHVNGTNAFYLYARLAGSGKFAVSLRCIACVVPSFFDHGQFATSKSQHDIYYE